MKLFSIIACLAFPMLLGAQENPYSQPESAYFHQPENVYFVSSINGDEMGWISKIGTNGNVIKAKWAKNLQRPMGMRAYAGRLWVNNKDEVVGIKLSDSKDRIVYPIDGANVLNDLATDPNGFAYLSDSMNSRIVKLNLATGENDTLLSTLPSSPNGVLVKGGKLYVASWGVMSDIPEEKAQWKTKTAGGLYWVSLNDSKLTKNYIVNELGNLDGLEIDKNGTIFVSDWVSGKLYQILPDNPSAIEIGNYGQGLADLALDPTTGTIALPMMLKNQVVFVK